MSREPRVETAVLLAEAGAPADSLLWLGNEAASLRYWDLVRGAGRGPVVDAVVEIAGQPVVYVCARPVPDPERARIIRALSLRGDGAALALWEPGRLIVHEPRLREVDPGEQAPTEREWILDRAARGAAGPPGRASREFLLGLLNGVVDGIVAATRAAAQAEVTPDVALALAGRALFARFLYDRHILTDRLIDEVAPGAADIGLLFGTAEHAASTSHWLDARFNGNLLPLPEEGSRGWFGSLPPTVFARLTDVMQRAPGGQLMLPLDWSGLDFAHIPVGLLSEVYEAHVARYDPEARDDSVHYTPRHVAEQMVRQSLGALDRPSRARVLDPAVGAGVFLVAAFRELAEHRWREDGIRPDRVTLREILANQLAGFDVRTAALRLSSLALYLTALELDPDPAPPAALRFDDLFGTVLFPVDGGDGLGSLGAAVGPEHLGRYDLVVGNPPWTAWKQAKALPLRLRERLQAIWESHGQAGHIPLHDKTPDLWFLWLATTWARSGGRLAMVVDARLLFRQSKGGVEARNGLFSAVRVTGLVNGAALRETDFWPGIRHGFALVFAVNEPPAPGETLWFVSPVADPPLNDVGRLRIDPETTHDLLIEDVLSEPRLLKTCFRGHGADRAVLRRLDRWPSLGTWWNEGLGLHREHQGFQVGGAAGVQQDARSYHSFHILRAEDRRKLDPFLSIPTHRLPKQDQATLLRPRDPQLYRAPLVVVPETLPTDRTRGRAALADGDLMYSESFHGWSCADAADPELLARYLLVVLNSEIVLFHALLTSGRFGVGRDTIYLEDLERLPIRPLEDLRAEEHAQLRDLSERLLWSRPPPWDELDAWVARILGLNPTDLATVRDTLATGLPAAQKRSLMPTKAVEREAWRQAASTVLAPMLASFGRIPTWDDGPARGPWRILRLRVDDGAARPLPDLRHLLDTADRLAVTEVVVVEGDALCLARIDQYRFWTPTRGRLLAARLLQDHGSLLAGTP